MARLNDDLVLGLVEDFRQGHGINLDDLDLALNAAMLYNFAFGDGKRAEVPVELLELCRHVVLERLGKAEKPNGRQSKGRRERAALHWSAAEELIRPDYKQEAAIKVLCAKHGIKRTTAKNALRDAKTEVAPHVLDTIGQKTPPVS